MIPRNTQTQWCRLLVESLALCGVKHAVISPGSRSTPLVTSMLACTKLTPQLVVDERSAAFFALGQSHITSKPSVLVCTSGSALAHYLPAIVEAKAQGLPLLILSADRPKELHGNCSPQTLDQDHFFGRHVVSHLTLPNPEPYEPSLRALRRHVTQAVARSLGPVPGPVHLNAPLRKPLEPCSAEGAPAVQLRDQVRQILRRPAARHVTPRPQGVDVTTLELVVREAKGAQRPALAFGPLPFDPPTRDALLCLARDCGWPVFSELTSQCRLERPGVFQADASDWFLGDKDAADVVPDFLLSFGGPLTSTVWQGVIAAAGYDCARVAVTQAGVWCDPHNAASAVVEAPAIAVARGLLGRLEAASSTWRANTTERNESAWRIIEQDLVQVSDFDEAQATRRVLDALRSEDTLVLGNSLPVRIVDQFARASKVEARVLSQRGLNGIDGLNSVAAGAASAKERTGQTYLLVGDISFLHDAGGLAVAAAQERLTIIVLNNHGGRIFEQLPIIEALKNLTTPTSVKTPEDFWLTPHRSDLAHASALHGIAHVRCADASELAQALKRSSAQVRVIEADLNPRHLPRRTTRIREALRRERNQP